MKRKHNKPQCPACNSKQVLHRRTDKISWCRVCGHEWKNNKKGSAVLDLICLIIIILILLIAVRFVHAETQYSDDEIVDAIYIAEGGTKAVKPFGILSVPCDGYEECRRICKNTVRNNRKRFADYGHKKFDTYLEFLASRYAPIGASNDPRNLNRNWLKNVRAILAKNRLGK